ncbi:MAG TPA: hypothetical protein VFH39_02140, partial [Candidatus Saccharimonadales bacterium]|nr:hypothetical protein [Candidatus Saccharimonadales bacterium]
LSGASGQLRTALGSVSARVPALQPASQKVVAVTTDLHARGDRLRTVVRTIDFLAVVLPWLIIAAVLGALAFSWSRRRTIIAIAVVFAGLILLELIGLKLARQTVLDQVQRPENLTAVAYVYDTVVTGLKSRLYWLLGAMAAIFVLCLLAGPARWAVRLRHLVRLDSLHNERFAEAWASARRWVHRYEPYLWLVALLGALVALAAAGAVTGRSVLNAGLIFLSLGALVHIIATPTQLQRREQSHGMKKARLSTMNS